MPPRKKVKKVKRKQADTSTKDLVPASPAKKVKTSLTSPEDRPRMTLASESIEKIIKNTSWTGRPPRLPRGLSFSAQGVKLQEKDEDTKQVEQDQDQEQQQQQQKRKSPLPPLPLFRATGQAGPSVPAVGSGGGSNRASASTPAPAPAAAAAPPAPLPVPVAATQWNTSQKLDATYDPMKNQAPNPYPPMLNAIEMTTEYYIKYHVDDKVPAHRRRQASLEWLILALNDENDPNNYRDNLFAVLTAYRRKHIIWTDDDLVTYWYQGEQVGGPKPFDVEEFRTLAAEREDPRGLWVEGLKVPAYLTLRP